MHFVQSALHKLYIQKLRRFVRCNGGDSLINQIDKSQYDRVEEPVQMQSQVFKIIHLTPKFTEEEHRSAEKAISGELYNVFKKYT